tara:strand:+ start:1834 stop:2121 length:288 start_codon:yes stop_codon:yes gene_type:complete
MQTEKRIKRNENSLYKQLSIYVPKHQRNFVQICEEFVKVKYPGESLSAFILECVRDKINTLSREDKKLFEEQAYKLAKKEKPTTTEFVDKFIKNM